MTATRNFAIISIQTGLLSARSIFLTNYLKHKGRAVTVLTPISLHVPKKSEGTPIVRAIFLHEKILYALRKGGCFHAGDVSGVERNGQRAEHPLDVTHPDVAG